MKKCETAKHNTSQVMITQYARIWRAYKSWLRSP